MADTRKPPAGFVSLTSMKKGPPDAATALAEIRRIYFKTSRQTIDNDFAHAIELLKALPDEESRSKAHVFMEGMAEMQRDWVRSGKSGGSGKSGKVSGGSRTGEAQRPPRPKKQRSE